MSQAEQNITKLYGDAVANAAKIAQQTQTNLGGLGQSAQQRMESVSKNTGGTSEGLRQAAVMPQAVLGNAQAQAGARGDILQQYLNAVGPAVAASAGAQERASGSAAAAQKQLGQAQIQAAREQAAASRGGGGAGGMTPSQTLSMLKYFDDLQKDQMREGDIRTESELALADDLTAAYNERRSPEGGFVLPGMEGRVPGRQAVGGLRQDYLQAASAIAGSEEAGAQLIDDILQQSRSAYETTYGLGGNAPARAQEAPRKSAGEISGAIGSTGGIGAALGALSRLGWNPHGAVKQAGRGGLAGAALGGLVDTDAIAESIGQPIGERMPDWLSNFLTAELAVPEPQEDDEGASANLMRNILMMIEQAGGQ